MELVYYVLKNDSTVYEGTLIVGEAGCTLYDYSGTYTIKQSDLESITTTPFSTHPNLKLFP